MLRLLHLTICEKYIIDLDGGVISLIAMFENLEVALPADAPEKLLYPLKWSVIGLWRREVSVEASVNYVQLVIVRTADNTEVFKIESPFTVFGNNLNFRNIVNFTGFPISATGVVEVEIYLKQEGENEWTKHFSYPLNVIRTIKEEENDEKDNIEKPNNIENQNDNSASR